MIGVTTGLAHHGDLPGCGRAVFGRIVRRQDLNFLDHVRGHLKVALDRDHAALAHKPFLHGCAVQKRLVAGLQPAVNPGVKCLITVASGHAGQKHGEAGRRPGFARYDERQILNCLRINTPLQRSVVIVNEGIFTFYGNRLCRGAYL